MQSHKFFTHKQYSCYVIFARVHSMQNQHYKGTPSPNFFECQEFSERDKMLKNLSTQNLTSTLHIHAKVGRYSNAV